MKDFIKKCLLILLILPSFVLALSNNQTIDDYVSNDHTSGQTSSVYSFGIGSTNGKYALKDSSNSMTWAEWLKINANGFNTDGYYVITTSGGSVSTTQAYEISYDLNGGTSTKPNNDFAYNGSSITLPAVPTRTGYTFTGWLNGSNTYSANSAYTVNATTSFIARWTVNNYTITFKGNGGIAQGDNGSILEEYKMSNLNYDNDYELTGNKFIRAGYSFKEWNTKADGTGSSYSDKQSIKNLISENNGNIDLHAIWTVGDLVFNNQEITSIYSKETKIIHINEPTAGSGNYSYSYNSEIDGVNLSKEGTLTIPSLNVNDAGYKIQVTVKDLSTNKEATSTLMIKILPYTITEENSDISMKTNYVYSGNVIKPEVSIKMKENTVGNEEIDLIEGQDFDITYDNSDDVYYDEQGNTIAHRISIKGKGNYTGTISKTYTITQKDIASDDIKVSYEKNHNWTGLEIKPEVTLTYNDQTLTPGIDYNISYSHNIDVGSENNENGPKITITGIGNFSETKTLGFNIKANELVINQTDD